MTARTLVHADPPFAPGPTTRFYCPVPVLETTFETMVLATVGRRPVTLLLGPPGAGKTTLLQRLINHWSETDCVLLAVVADPGMDVEALVRSGAGTDVGDASGLDELVDALERRLDESGTGLLVVDDAHRLRPAILAELVDLSASRTERGNYMQVVLGGLPSLADGLATVVGGPLDAVAAVCTVPALPQDQIDDLIRHRLSVVGEVDGHPFTPGAIGAVAEAAQGRPGAAIGMAATVMEAAHGRGADRVDAGFVRDVLVPGRPAARRPGRRRTLTSLGGRGRPTLLLVLLLAAGGTWAGVEYAERIGFTLPGAPSATPAQPWWGTRTTVPIESAPPMPPAAPAPPPPPPAPPPVVTAPQPDPNEGRVRALAQRADRQLEQKRLTTPIGDNALDTVREIEGLVPDHEAARRLRGQIAETYVRWARQAEVRRQVDDARRFYTRALQAKPDDAALREMLSALDGRGRTPGEETTSPGEGGSGGTIDAAALPPPATGEGLPPFVRPIDFIGPKALIEALDRPDVLRAVIDAGRDFDRPLPDGRTPLMVAAASGRIAAMRVLMDEAKVGVDRRDPAGWTALMYAAASGQAEAARVLLTGGADRSLRNNAGRTAEDLSLAAPRGPMSLSQRR
jgi:type II secretory pathway predicted ATPase ExeA